MKKMFLLLMLVFATFCGSAMADEAYVQALNGASVGTSSAVIDLNGYDGFFVSSTGQGVVQWLWSRTSTLNQIGGGSTTVPGNVYVPKQARYVYLKNSGTGANVVTAYYSRHFNPTVVVDAAGNTLLALQQGPAGAEAWPVTLADEFDSRTIDGTTTNIIGKESLVTSSQGFGLDQTTNYVNPITLHKGTDPLSLQYFASDISIQDIGNSAVGNQNNSPGSMPSANQDWKGNGIGSTYDAVADDGSYDLFCDLRSIAGVQTDYVDNNGYRAQVMGLVGNGNSYYTDVLALGDDASAPSNGLVTIAATYDGFGNPIVSANSNSILDPADYLLGTASAGFGFYDDGNTYSRPISAVKPGEWYSTFSTPSNAYGWAGVMSLDAVGGVATYPAFDPRNGVGSEDGNAFQGVGSITMALLPAISDRIFNYTTAAYDGDGVDPTNRIGLDTNQALWGGTAVSAADFYASLLHTPNPDTASLSLAPVFSMLGANDQAGTYDAPEGALAVSGQYIYPGQNEDDVMNDGNGIFAADVAGHVVTWGFEKVAPADANGAIQVTGPSASNTSGVIATTGAITIGVNKLLQNFTAKLVWDGSVGADTFTATLEGSYTGNYASDGVVLATITEGTSGLKASVQGNPFPYTRLNLSALSLDTATGINMFAAGMQ